MPTEPVPGRRAWRTKNITGQKYGHLTVLDPLPPDGSGKIKWNARCDCGTMVVRMTSEFTKGAKVCSNKCPHHRPNISHDMSRHPAYWVWRSMRDRCRLPTHQAWKNYGARGIKVCDRWNESFQNFWEDMGPSYVRGLTLERVDNEAGYSKENCVWVSHKAQNNNRRTNVRIKTPWGELTVSQASEKSGIGVTTLLYRIANGVPYERMFEKPNFTNRFTT